MTLKSFIIVTICTAVITRIVTYAGFDVKAWYMGHVPEWLRITLMLTGIGYLLYSIAAYFYHLKKQKK